MSIRITTRWLIKFAEHLKSNPDCQYLAFVHGWSGSILVAKRTTQLPGNGCETDCPFGIDGWDFFYEGYKELDDLKRNFLGKTIVVFADDYENLTVAKYTISINYRGDVFWYNEKGQSHGLNDATPAIEYADGTKSWYKNGKLHRDDGPAVVRANGDKSWYQNNQFHREDGPAIEHANGTKYWYQNGKLHREDGPAVEYESGYKEWWRNSQLHREDGPAIEYPNGDKEWWQNDLLHRENGPAVESLNYKQWLQNGALHRLDGPAVIDKGNKEYWIEGKKYSKEEFDKLAKNTEKDTCNGKIVEIDGKKYKLTEI